MKIPSRWYPYVEACCAGVPPAGQVRMRAEQLLKEHGAARARKLKRTLPARKAEAADRAALDALITTALAKAAP